MLHLSLNIPLEDKGDEKEEASQHVAKVNDSEEDAIRFGDLAWCIILTVDDEMMKMMPRKKKSLKNRV